MKFFALIARPHSFMLMTNEQSFSLFVQIIYFQNCLEVLCANCNKLKIYQANKNHFAKGLIFYNVPMTYIMV